MDEIGCKKKELDIEVNIKKNVVNNKFNKFILLSFDENKNFILIISKILEPIKSLLAVIFII